MTQIRIGAALILTAALAVSYMHLVELAEAFGETGWRAYVIAATVDTLILLAVLSGRAARAAGTTPGPVIRWALSAGIAATIVGNVHHGIRANIPDGVFADGVLRPDIDALGVATVVVGIVVSLWAPLAAEISYRVLLWAQDQTARPVAAQEPATPDSAAAAPAGEPDGVDGQEQPDPDPDTTGDDDGHRPGPPPEPVDGHVLELYRRQRGRGERVSERGLVSLAHAELGLDITRHQARKAIAAAKLAAGQHRRAAPPASETVGLPELAAV